MRFGLVVTPTFLPDAGELAQLQPAFLRSILYHVADLDKLKATGYPLLLTVNNECAEVAGWSGWDDTMRQIAARSDGQVLGVCVGNEFDLWWQDNHGDVPPSFAADLVKRAAAILRPAGIKTIATSVAGRDWQEYLAEMADLCREDADLFDFHGYGQRPDGWGSPGWFWGDLRVSLGHAYELAGKPVLMSEYGVKIGDAGGELAVATFMQAAADTLDTLGPRVCPYAAWFAWSDMIGAPSERGQAAFGLRRENGTARPAWNAFATLRDTAPPAPAPVPVPIPPVEVIPMANLEQWKGRVGSGLLDMIAEDKTEPVMNSEWRPFGRPAGAPAEVEQVFGLNGTQYVWYLVPNIGFRFPAGA